MSRIALDLGLGASVQYLLQSAKENDRRYGVVAAVQGCCPTAIPSYKGSFLPRVELSGTHLPHNSGVSLLVVYEQTTARVKPTVTREFSHPHLTSNVPHRRSLLKPESQFFTVGTDIIIIV